MQRIYLVTFDAETIGSQHIVCVDSQKGLLLYIEKMLNAANSRGFRYTLSSVNEIYRTDILIGTNVETFTAEEERFYSIPVVGDKVKTILKRSRNDVPKEEICEVKAVDRYVITNVSGMFEEMGYQITVEGRNGDVILGRGEFVIEEPRIIPPEESLGRENIDATGADKCTDEFSFETKE